MAGFRINYPAGELGRPRKGKTDRVKNGDYLDFIRSLPCIVTGLPAEAAHLSYASPRHLAFGRGKGRKVSDRWALPLSATEHRRQHGMSEPTYWSSVGIEAPHALALTIYGAWCERGDQCRDDVAELIYMLHIQRMRQDDDDPA